MSRLCKKLITLFLICTMAITFTGCVNTSGPNYITPIQDTSIFSGRYFYEQLSDTDKRLYEEIYQGLYEHSKNFTVHCADGDDSNRVFYCILMDFPEMFWPDGNIVSTAYNNSYTTIEAQYNCTKSEREQKALQIEQAVSAALSDAASLTSDYDKIKFVYEYVVNTVDYVAGAPDNQNLYSALVNKQSVCAGYAKATQYLLSRMGIECIYVLGQATNSQTTDAHAWNIVKCNGQYYHVDSTWADPLFAGNRDDKVKDEMVYDYLCCSDTTLSQTHVKDSAYTYPACVSDDLNYYRMNQMFYSSANASELRSAMYRSIDAKEASITFKFADSTTYTQARNTIVNTLLNDAIQYLGRKYGIQQVKCYYSEDAKLNKFIVYWDYQ